MRINQNIAAFNAYRNLSQTQGTQAKSLEKLSSGFRINRAADDASGLVNSENLRSQIGGLKVATRNAQDAISLAQTAEGAQTEVHSMLQRMRDLVVQSGNLGTNDSAALKANQDEIGQLKSELTRIAEQTQFGTKKILNGADYEIGDTLAGLGNAAGTGAAEAEALGDALQALGGAVASALEGIDFSGESFTADAAGDTAAAARKTVVDAALATVEIGGQALSDIISTTASTDNSGTLTFGFTAASPALTATDGITVDGETVIGAQSFVFQVGANSGQTVEVAINAVHADALGAGAKWTDSDGTEVDSTYASVGEIDLTAALATGETQEDRIAHALATLDQAIGSVSENRATLGAFQNRMESTIRNVGVAVENLQAAESRIRDTDMAEEMVNFTRSQILSQAGTAMLAQANQVPQNVLSLLR